MLNVFRPKDRVGLSLNLSTVDALVIHLSILRSIVYSVDKYVFLQIKKTLKVGEE